MDLALFEHFMVIAEMLSFTKAAEKLGKSESVLSRQMVRLEKELGLELFERSTRKVTLTPAGEVLKRGIAASLESFEALIDEAHDAMTGETGVIKIATLPNYILPEYTFGLIRKFKETYNKIDIEMVSANLSEFANLMLSGQVDFVFAVIDDYKDIAAVESIFMEETKNYLLVSPDNPAVRKNPDELSLDDFRDCEILMGTENPRKRNSVKTLCESFGFTPVFRNVFDETQYTMLLLQGTCIGITDETHILSDNRRLMHIYLPELGSCRLGFSYVSDRLHSFKRAFIDYMLKSSKNRA